MGKAVKETIHAKQILTVCNSRRLKMKRVSLNSLSKLEAGS